MDRIPSVDLKVTSFGTKVNKKFIDEEESL
jgi:hypothetical protein